MVWLTRSLWSVNFECISKWINRAWACRATRVHIRCSRAKSHQNLTQHSRVKKKKKNAWGSIPSSHAHTHTNYEGRLKCAFICIPWISCFLVLKRQEYHGKKSLQKVSVKHCKSFWLKVQPSIICRKYWKNCANYEKAVTTSEILTEYTTRSCTKIGSNNCRL